MSYVLNLSPTAAQQLAAQPEPLRGFVVAALHRLAESPVSVARRSPSVTAGQRAEFKFDHGGAVLWVTVTFLYGQDEQTLHVELITVEFGA